MLNEQEILIVEDEALIALDLTMMLEDRGAAVSGPCGTLPEAAQAVRRGAAQYDAAILDVDLRGEPIFPIADALQEKGVPMVFHTARFDIATLRARYADAPILRKPAREDQIVGVLETVTADATDGEAS